MGLVIYYALSGDALYANDTAYNLLVKAAQGPGAKEFESLDKLPPQVSRIVERALQPDVNLRYQTAGEFAQALAPLIAGAHDGLARTMERLFGEDIKAEEKQRVAGFIPNFYVAYNWNAPPMNARQKFKLSVRGIVDPANFLISGIAAGIEQGTNAFPEYGQGAVGFGKRYGASLADGTVGSLLGGAVFPALLRQDPRYFYKGTGSVTSRTLYALAAAFICRGDNGRWQPNYSSVLGDVATGAISNTYYPESSRTGWAETVEVGLLNAFQQGISNLMQEFVFKRISTGVANKPKRP